MQTEIRYCDNPEKCQCEREHKIDIQVVEVLGLRSVVATCLTCSKTEVIEKTKHGVSVLVKGNTQTGQVFYREGGK